MTRDTTARPANRTQVLIKVLKGCSALTMIVVNDVDSEQRAGISSEGIEDGYRSGYETRPKNMNVIYIIKVY